MAAVYAGLAFAAGFALGVARVLVLEPRLGPLGAVIVEGPPMLAISWLAARWIVGRWMSRARRERRLLMGVVGLGLLLLAELAISPLVNAGAPAGWLSAFFDKFLTPAGLVGAFLQLAFAGLPALVTPRGDSRDIGPTKEAASR